jgi:murein DD-endopeptidase MepM/ murein hydrolase activator NlpD
MMEPRFWADIHEGRWGFLMSTGSVFQKDGLLPKLRSLFRSRELFIHDGASMRRVHVSSKLQMMVAGGSLVAAAGLALSVGQLVAGAVTVSGSVSTYAAHRSEVVAMEQRVASLQADVVAVKAAARDHAKLLETRQSFLAAMLEGHADAAKLSALIPARVGESTGEAADIAAVFEAINREQVAMASKLRAANEARFASAASVISRLGVSTPPVVSGAMGGPYEPVAADTPLASAPAKADPQFRALFDSWKKLDSLQTTLISIPSEKPVPSMTSLTSNYGVRRDPFRGGRAMHAGIDIPGAHAAQIVATADAIVGRTGWIGGYGNMIELEHGKGIQTRYGHLSSIMVSPGTRIKRGQVIGLMGSTGRSTGTHLHYEVRIDGRPVNPTPFLQTSDYLLAMQQRVGAPIAVGGPVEKGSVAGSK